MANAVTVIDRPQQNIVPVFTMSDIERIATAIARGGLFGVKDPNAVLTLCLLAQAEGQHPAVVMRDYDLIQGKPAKKSEAMLRDFISSGGRVTWNRLDDECADATFSHPQGGEVTINWTMARAAKAQLAGKDMWKKFPRQMLRSRVVSEGIRTVCPSATSGLYVPEEIRDFGSDTPSDTPATPQAKRARDLKPEPQQIEAQAESKVETTVRAKAEAWVAEFIGKLGETDVDGAVALFAKSGNAISKLERDHPDLHEQVMKHQPTEDAVVEEVEAEVIAAPDPAASKGDDILNGFAKAATVIDLNKLKAEADTHLAFMPEPIAEAIEGGYAKELKRLGGKVKEPV